MDSGEKQDPSSLSGEGANQKNVSSEDTHDNDNINGESSTPKSVEKVDVVHVTSNNVTRDTPESVDRVDVVDVTSNSATGGITKDDVMEVARDDATHGVNDTVYIIKDSVAQVVNSDVIQIINDIVTQVMQSRDESVPATQDSPKASIQQDSGISENGANSVSLGGNKVRGIDINERNLDGEKSGERGDNSQQVADLGPVSFDKDAAFASVVTPDKSENEKNDLVDNTKLLEKVDNKNSGVKISPVSEKLKAAENPDSTDQDCSGKEVQDETKNDLSHTTSVKRSFEVLPRAGPLSEKEKDHFAFINEQLLILNKESTDLNTSIHKSSKYTKKDIPSKQKRLDKRRGLVTPRKKFSGHGQSPNRKMVKRKLKVAASMKVGEKKKGEEFNADSGDISDTSSESGLLIDEVDIDDKLEENASKTGLTAINVRNILHHILTNEAVVSMLRNKMNEGMAGAESSESAYEPKMTRAKVREVIEKGKLPQSWHLSPVKKPAAKKPSILEIDFTDDEEDEEYNPEKDAELLHESDDDTESLVSSRVSEHGSPYPPTPSTPQSSGPLVKDQTPGTSDTTFPSPGDSPSPCNQKKPSGLGQNFRDSMAALEESQQPAEGEEDADTIAKRTRSKLPLTDTSLTAIEEAFIAPDITPDMYDTNCDDSEWQEFLRSLVKSDEGQLGATEDLDANDDDANDPEFNFLAEAEKVDVDDEDFRFDRPFRVSKKELSELIDELQEFLEGEEDDEKIPQNSGCSDPLPIMELSPPMPPPPLQPQKTMSVAELARAEVMSPNLHVSADQKLIIEDNMRKHIQLTTQMHFLSHGSEDYQFMAPICKQLLRELDLFRTVSSVGVLSSFNVCNLTEALQLVEVERHWNILAEVEEAGMTSHDDSMSNATDSDHESIDTGKQKLKRPSTSRNRALLHSQKDIFWNSPVFLYPDILPKHRLMTQDDALDCRVCFMPGEDNLIALGMEQFQNQPLYRSLIQRLLLPCKTVQQISFRIKNLNAKNKTGDNAVKFYRKHKRAPDFPQEVDHFNPDRMKAPKDQDLSTLPKWCKGYKEKLEQDGNRRASKALTAKRKRSSSISIPSACNTLNTSEISESDAEYRSKSAPVSPVDDLLDEESDRKRRRKERCQPSKKKTVEETYGSLAVTSESIPCNTNTATALITSSGVFVPIHFASPTKISSAMQNCGINFKHLNDVECSLQQNISPGKDVCGTSGKAKQVSKGLGLGAIRGSIRVVPSRTGRKGTMSTLSTVACSNSSAPTHIPHSPLLTSSPLQFSSQSRARPSSPVTHTLPFGSAEIESSQMETPEQMDWKSHSESSKQVISDETSQYVNQRVIQGSPQPLKELDHTDGSSCLQESKKTSVSDTSQQPSQRAVPNEPVQQKIQAGSNESQTLMHTVQVSTSRPLTACVTGSEGVTSPVVQNLHSPLEVIAVLSPYYSSAISTPVKSPTAQQVLLERTPTKKYAPVPNYRDLKPKPYPPDSFAPKPVSPFLAKSPKRKLLQKQAQAILPKGFVFDAKVSPSKRAALSLIKKAQVFGYRVSPCKLLPKPDTPRQQLPAVAKPCTRRRAWKRKKSSAQNYAPPVLTYQSESEDLSDGAMEVDDQNFNNNNSETAGKETTNKKGQKLATLNEGEIKQEESDDVQSETEDLAGLSQDESQNEDDLDDGRLDDLNHLDTLMTASTTIRFDPRKPSVQDRSNRSKAQKRKDLTQAMLAPDLLDTDPKKDDKDTAYAQDYLNQVRDTLKDNLDVYEQFLRTLYEFGKIGHSQSAVKLYCELRELLKDYPALIDDFARFLLPDQAIECGCFTTNQEFMQARIFLCKLELNFEKQPGQLQRVLKAFTQWFQHPHKSYQELKDNIKPLLKGMPHLQEEFSLFFPDDKPPESYMTDFEEITLGDSDLEDDASVDSFEEVEMPDEIDTYRTSKCPCDCHSDPTDIKLQKRLKHCLNCSLKVVDGRLYFQTNSKKLQPAKVTFHKPVDVSSPVPQEVEDDQAADKENVICINSGPTIVSSSSSSRSPPAKSRKVKLKISKQKAGQKRFLALNEVVSSPTKTTANTNTTVTVNSSRSSKPCTVSSSLTQQNKVIEAKSVCADGSRKGSVLESSPGIGLTQDRASSVITCQADVHVSATTCTESTLIGSVPPSVGFTSQTVQPSGEKQQKSLEVEKRNFSSLQSFSSGQASSTDGDFLPFAAATTSSEMPHVTEKLPAMMEQSHLLSKQSESAIAAPVSEDPGLSGLGLSMFGFPEMSNMSYDISQSSCSDILAKAMKTAQIKQTDSEPSVSMDFMQKILGPNFNLSSAPNSRNSSSHKKSNSPPLIGITETNPEQVSGLPNTRIPVQTSETPVKITPTFGAFKDITSSLQTVSTISEKVSIPSELTPATSANVSPTFSSPVEVPWRPGKVVETVFSPEFRALVQEALSPAIPVQAILASAVSEQVSQTPVLTSANPSPAVSSTAQVHQNPGQLCETQLSPEFRALLQETFSPAISTSAQAFSAPTKISMVSASRTHRTHMQVTSVPQSTALQESRIFSSHTQIGETPVQIFSSFVPRCHVPAFSSSLSTPAQTSRLHAQASQPLAQTSQLPAQASWPPAQTAQPLAQTSTAPTRVSEIPQQKSTVFVQASPSSLSPVAEHAALGPGLSQTSLVRGPCVSDQTVQLHPSSAGKDPENKGNSDVHSENTVHQNIDRMDSSNMENNNNGDDFPSSDKAVPEIGSNDCQCIETASIRSNISLSEITVPQSSGTELCQTMEAADNQKACEQDKESMITGSCDSENDGSKTFEEMDSCGLDCAKESSFIVEVETEPCSADSESVLESGELAQGLKSSTVAWTREMDKCMLEMCKKHGPNEDTFAQIATKFQDITAEQVHERFYHLMMILAATEPEESDSEATS